MQKSGGLLANKKTISYVLIVLAIVALLIGVFTKVYTIWLLVAAAFLVVGIVFYRRAKKQQE